MQLALEFCRLYAPIDRAVVFVGPVGAGKTTLARCLHDLSGRPGDLVAVSGGEMIESLFSDTLFGHQAGAFTGATGSRPGVFERAKRGTVLFDDLHLMSGHVQAALLRTLEDRHYLPLGGSTDRPISSREVFAATEFPNALVDCGALLPDLASRLGELIIEVPGLSERVDDIPTLARNVAERFRSEHGLQPAVDFTEEAMESLVNYSWPQNIRELCRVVERAVVHAGQNVEHVVIARQHLPQRILDPDKAGGSGRRRVNRDLVIKVLKDTGGNRSETARRLGYHRNTVSKYTPSDFRPEQGG